MMVRTMAVGFLVSAFLLFRYTVEFYRDLFSGEVLFSFGGVPWGDAALASICAAFVISCLGAGFAVAGVCWPLLERSAAWLLSSIHPGSSLRSGMARRHED